MGRMDRLFGAFDCTRDKRTLPPEIFRRMVAFLDGDRVRYTVAFDTEAGWLDHYALDDEGRLVSQGGKPVIQRRLGVVTVFIGNLRGVEAEALHKSGRRFELGTRP